MLKLYSGGKNLLKACLYILCFNKMYLYTPLINRREKLMILLGNVSSRSAHFSLPFLSDKMVLAFAHVHVPFEFTWVPIIFVQLNPLMLSLSCLIISICCKWCLPCNENVMILKRRFKNLCILGRQTFEFSGFLLSHFIKNACLNMPISCKFCCCR